MKKINVKVVGAGGIGSKLIPVISQHLNFSNIEDVNLTIIDGDVYKDHNRSRQDFSETGNKAEVTASDLQNRFSKITFWNEDCYLTKKNINLLIEENDYVFLCVDNHATRKLVSEYCKNLKNVVLISGGNEIVTGNVQVFVREKGKNKTLPLNSVYHPEIDNPKDVNPGDNLSCMDLVEGSPQLVITNNLVASLMSMTFYQVLENKLDYDEIYADISFGKIRTVKRN